MANRLGGYFSEPIQPNFDDPEARKRYEKDSERTPQKNPRAPDIEIRKDNYTSPKGMIGSLFFDDK